METVWANDPQDILKGGREKQLGQGRKAGVRAEEGAETVAVNAALSR